MFCFKVVIQNLFYDAFVYRQLFIVFGSVFQFCDGLGDTEVLEEPDILMNNFEWTEQMLCEILCNSNVAEQFIDLSDGINVVGTQILEYDYY